MCNVFLKYNSVFRSFFVVFVSIFLFLDAISQDYKSEADLAKNAEKLFEERNYVEALPLFAQLASLHPQNPNYNFKYGACLLFAGDDKEKPLKYLKFAIGQTRYPVYIFSIFSVIAITGKIYFIFSIGRKIHY